MAIPNCVSPQEMTPEQAANALVLLKGMVGREVGIGVWEGSIKSALTGNAFQGKHVSVFNEDSLIAPFGQVGEQRAEAGAALFAIALHHADKIAKELNTDFKFDATFVSEEDQVAALRMSERDANEGIADDDSPAKLVVTALTNKWVSKIRMDDHAEINDLFKEIESTIGLLKRFRNEVKENMEACNQVDMTQVLVDKATKGGLEPSHLESIVKEAFYFTKEKDDSVKDPATDTPEHVNASGLKAQVECLVEAYGLAGALSLLSDAVAKNGIPGAFDVLEETESNQKSKAKP